MPWYQAPAKINLGLWIGARDKSGYHPVDSVMQGVAFSDQLYLEPRDYMLWESTSPQVPMDERNLVVRAYAWAKARLPSLTSVYGRLEKITWVGAGLGGGSSDAAALIRWAFDGSNRKTADWLGETAELGMDVPFFVRGGAARAEGHGEQLTPVPSLAAGGVVLANPGESLSTADVYAAFDRLRAPADRGDWLDAVMQALQSGEMPLAQDLKNNLEPAAFQVMPSLRDFRELIAGAADGATFALSGSGPTYYLLGSDEEWADWMARRLTGHGVPWVRATNVSESW